MVLHQRSQAVIINHGTLGAISLCITFWKASWVSPVCGKSGPPGRQRRRRRVRTTSDIPCLTFDIHYSIAPSIAPSISLCRLAHASVIITIPSACLPRVSYHPTRSFVPVSFLPCHGLLLILYPSVRLREEEQCKRHRHRRSRL